MAKNECIDARSTRGTESAIEILESNPVFVVGCDIFRNVMDRIAKVELQLCTCYGDKPYVEPPIYGDDDEL